MGLLKYKVAPTLLASIFPLVLTGELPERVKVFDPTVRVPFVNVKVPITVRFPYKLTPLARFIVKLLSIKAGMFMIVPLPPMIILVVLPPVTVPVMAVTIPLNVKVLGPMAKLPAIRAMPLFILKSPFNVKPFTLFIASESIVLFTNEPDGMFWAVEPANTTLEEVAVASIFALYVKDKSPVNVSCFPFKTKCFEL